MTTALDVVFQYRAARDVEEINTWWRVNRPAAPDLFLLELLRPGARCETASHPTADLAANALSRVLPGSWTGARGPGCLACRTRQRPRPVATTA
jgi:hypothetical protein